MTTQEQRARQIGHTIGRIIGSPIGIAIALLLLPIIAIEKLITSTKSK